MADDEKKITGSTESEDDKNTDNDIIRQLSAMYSAPVSDDGSTSDNTYGYSEDTDSDDDGVASAYGTSNENENDDDVSNREFTEMLAKALEQYIDRPEENSEYVGEVEYSENVETAEAAEVVKASETDATVEAEKEPEATQAADSAQEPEFIETAEAVDASDMAETAEPETADRKDHALDSELQGAADGDEQQNINTAKKIEADSVLPDTADSGEYVQVSMFASDDDSIGITATPAESTVAEDMNSDTAVSDYEDISIDFDSVSDRNTESAADIYGRMRQAGNVDISPLSATVGHAERIQGGVAQNSDNKLPDFSSEENVNEKENKDGKTPELSEIPAERKSREQIVAKAYKSPVESGRDTGDVSGENSADDVTVEKAIEAARRVRDSQALYGDGLNGTDIAQTTPYDNVSPELVGRITMPDCSSSQRQNDMTGDDMKTLIALGYDKELDDMVDPIEVGRIAYGAEHSEEAGEDGTSKSKGANKGKSGAKAEFERSAQVGAFLRRFDIKIIRLYVCFVVCVSAAILLFFIENYNIFGLESIGTLTYAGSPVNYSLLCMLLIAIASAVSWKPLLEGLRALIALEPTQYSLPAVTVIITLLYDVTAAIVNVGDSFARINSPAVVCLSAAALCELFNVQRERNTFKKLAGIESETVEGKRSESLFCAEEIKRRPDGRKKGRSVLGLGTVSEGGVYRIKNAEFIEGFFGRTERRASYNRILNLLVIPIIIFSAVNPAISLLLYGDVIRAVNTYFLTVVYCMPFSTVVCSCLPMYFASKALNERNCGIIGEASAQEYAQNNEFIFDSDEHIRPERNEDTGSFVRFYGTKGENMQRYLYLTNRLFDSIGVSLDSLIDTSGSDSVWREKEIHTDLIEVSENGIDAYLNSSVHIVAGDISYMKKKGIRVPQESLDRIMLRRDNCSVMYVAFDNRLKIRYELTYNVSARFERMIRRLSSYGATFSVRTYDPNINKRFYKKIRSGKSVPVGIIKPDNLEYSSDRVNSGIFAVGNAGNIALPLEYCNRVVKAQRAGKVIRVVGTVLSMALTCWLTAIGHLCDFGSFFVVLYHTLWCSAMAFVSYKTVMGGKKKK